MSQFQIVAVKDSKSTADILLYGTIEKWSRVSAREIKSLLTQAEELGYTKVNARIHCPGGDVMEGLGIKGAFEQSPLFVTAIVEGLCASMMTISMLGADRIVATGDARFMLHEPRVRPNGFLTAKKLLKKGKDLEKLRDDMATTYAERTGKGVDFVKQNWMDEDGDDFWFSAKEAKEASLIDEIIPPKVKVNTQALLSEDYSQMVACYDEAFQAYLEPNPKEGTQNKTHTKDKPKSKMSRTLLEQSLRGLGVEFTAETSDEELLAKLTTQTTVLQQEKEAQATKIRENEITGLKTLMQAKNVPTKQAELYLDMVESAGLEKVQAIINEIPDPVDLSAKAQQAKEKNKGRKPNDGEFKTLNDLQEVGATQEVMTFIEENQEDLEDFAKAYAKQAFE